MKLIVGLGNPGVKYQNNRHNAGHTFVDYATNRHLERSERSHNLEEISLPTKRRDRNDVRFVRTTVFMNQSGVEVKKLVSRFTLRVSHDLVVVHDDLDIPLGKFKIQKGEGPRLHNGISSIEKALGSKDFWRIRIGVDNRDPNPPVGGRIDGETYVLQDFTREEKAILLHAFDDVVDKWKNVFHNKLIQ